MFFLNYKKLNKHKLNRHAKYLNFTFMVYFERNICNETCIKLQLFLKFLPCT